MVKQGIKFSTAAGAYYCPAFGKLLTAIMAKNGLRLGQPASRLLSCGPVGTTNLLIEVRKPGMVKVAWLEDGKERPSLTYWIDQAGRWYPIACAIADIGEWKYCRVKVKADHASGLELLVSIKLEQQKDAAHYSECLWLSELAKFKAGKSAA